MRVGGGCVWPFVCVRHSVGGLLSISVFACMDVYCSINTVVTPFTKSIISVNIKLMYPLKAYQNNNQIL